MRCEDAVGPGRASARMTFVTSPSMVLTLSGIRSVVSLPHHNVNSIRDWSSLNVLS